MVSTLGLNQRDIYFSIMVENSEKLLIEDWRSGGIDAGDVVLVHSNLRRLYRRYLKYGIRLSPEQILQSLIEAVGSAGTLLLPLYNFDFTKGSVFDISNKSLSLDNFKYMR